MQKVSIISLGCAKNLVHSETMMGIFQAAGYELTEQYDQAEIIIINTCGFITAAKEESIHTILEMAQWKEEGNCQLLVAVGCFVQKYAKELAEEMPEIDLLVGTNSYQEIVQIIQNYQKTLQPEISQEEAVPTLPNAQRICVHDRWTKESEMTVQKRVLTTPQHYAYLRISEGCDNHCTYCVIPEMQGPYRSKRIAHIVEEAKELACQGVTELILVGQDTSYYGRDLYGEFALVALLKELVSIEEIRWIRILYAYPNNFDEAMIAYIAQEPKICKYLDIPLQHADDEILKQMNRHITQQQIRSLVAILRQYIPDITIRSTFIVGFPGETEAQYQNLLQFLEDMELDCVGAFPYSREEGTLADRMPGHLSESEKEKRAEHLMDLQYEIMYQKHQRAIGQKRLVKVDELSQDVPGLLLCRSQGEAPDVDPWIFVYDGGDHQPGDYIYIKITGLDEYDFIGEMIDEFA